MPADPRVPSLHAAHPLAVACYDSARSSRAPAWTATDATWGQTIAHLDQWRRAPDKLSAPCWAPHHAPGRRRLSEIDAVSCLVVDYDHLDHELQAYGLLHGLEYFGWTTWSSTPAQPRWRVVLPLAVPIAAQWWSRVYALSLARYAPLADPACSDPTRIHVLPVVGPAGHCETRYSRGALLDLSPQLAQAQAAHAAELAEQEARRRKQAAKRVLARLDGDSQRARRLALRSDPDTRRSEGARMGGVVTDSIARRICCPSCGRRSVWYSLTGGDARCDHQSSCGYRAPLEQLVQEVTL